MDAFSQVELFRQRAEQHEQCARHVTAPDIIRFHADLAAHYRRLAGEVSALVPHRVRPTMP